MRARVSFPLASGVLLLSALTQKWYLSLFAAPLLLPLLAGLASREGIADALRVKRVLPSRRVHLGHELPVTLVVENVSSRTVLAEVEDRVPQSLPVSAGSPRQLVVLRPGEVKQLSYRVYAARRGRFDFGPLTVRAWDEFLTLPASRDVPEAESVVVLPPVQRLLWLPLRQSVTLPGFGDFPSKRGGEGFEFIELSEARSSSLRRVNWKATAKFEKLMVNLYAEERSASVLVVLEVPGRRLLGALTENLLEDLVAAAASITAYLHKRGHRVSLLVVGWYRDWVQPGFGKGHFLRLLSSLASVRVLPHRQVADPRDIVAKVVPFLSPTGSLVILVSPFVERQGTAVAGELERLGFRTIYVAVNPFSSLRDEEVAERLTEVWVKGVLRRLAGRSIWLWTGARGRRGIAVVRQIA